MAQPVNNVGAGPEQAEEEMALEFLVRADTRPLESLDIERLLSSEFYSNGAFDYAQYHPVRDPASYADDKLTHARHRPAPNRTTSLTAGNHQISRPQLKIVLPFKKRARM